MIAQVQFVSPSEFVLNIPTVHKWREDLSVFIDGAQFSPKYKEGKWDGRQYPGRWSRGQLFLKRGMLSTLAKDYTLQVTTPPESSPPLPTWSLEGLGLRDFQVDGVSIAEKRRWGRLALATNAGKGAIIALLAKRASEAGMKALILTDEISVFAALEKEIAAWAPGTAIGKVEAGLKEPPSELITLAMVPTLHRRTKLAKWKVWFREQGMVLLDEGDKASATTWQKILRSCTHSHYRIGFSGTFQSEHRVEDPVEELILQETVGPVLMRIRNAELITRGISARPVVTLHPYSHDIRLPRDWHTMTGPEKRLWAYEEHVTLNTERHALIEEMLQRDAPNAIVVNYVEHGRQLAAHLPDAVFLYGDDDKEVRAEVLGQFQRGEFQNLVVTKILDRGTNELGHAIGLIFASGQGSTKQTLQRVGRGLRRKDGKAFLFLRDVIDRGFKYFDTASAKRIRLYNDEDFDVHIQERSEQVQMQL